MTEIFDPLPILVGTRSGLFRTDGRTHRPILDGASVLGLHTDGAFVACAVGTGGIAVSNDGGASWIRREVPGWEVVCVTQDPQRPGRLYAGTKPAAVLVSEDRGEHWTMLKNLYEVPGAEEWDIPVLDPTKPVTSAGTGEGAAAWAVKVDPFRPGRIIVGVEVGGLAVSEDGGATWRVMLVGDSPDPHDICLHPTDPRTVVVSTGYSRFTETRGVFRYSQSGGVYRSDDGLDSFRNVWPPDPEPQYTRLMCVDHRAPHPFTVCARSSYVQPSNPAGERRADLRQSTDGGETWRSIGDAEHAVFGEEYSAVATDPAAVGNVYVGTEKGRLFHVDASAFRWTELAGFDGRITCIAPIGMPVARRSEPALAAVAGDR